MAESNWIQGKPGEGEEILKTLLGLGGFLPDNFPEDRVEELFGDPDYIFWVNGYKQIKGTKDPGIINVVKGHEIS